MNRSSFLLLLVLATTAHAQFTRKALEPDLAPGGKSTVALLKQPPRPARLPLPPSRIPLEFIAGERIALVGNSLAERMHRRANFETLLHSRFPKLELVVRSFARPADELTVRQRSPGYTSLDDPLAAFGADTYLCFFGFNESFAGPAGVEKFKADYEAFLDEFTRQYPRDETGAAPRFVLISPIACEASGEGFLPSGEAENADLRLYAAAVEQVAARRGLAYVDLFAPTAALFARERGLQFTIDGAHQNDAGDREVALLLDRALFGTTPPAAPGSTAFERLRAAVCDKAWVHDQDHRMLNGWYVYGGRNTLDRETFPPEFLKIRAMASVRDRYIWDLAQGKPVAAQPDDSQTGELVVPPTRFGTQPQREPKELRYPTPEESIGRMKVPPGFEVQLVASEREVPGLANVDQINFDSRGRLWASCMASYTMWKPGDPKPSDRLVIFDQLDPQTGRAGKATVFYDKLVCPTGFEFWNGGVLVVDEPRLLFLKDTDGDDRADVVIDLIDGWASDDTHHAIGAFEWSPGGLLHMLEGVSLYTAIETPWGPLRRGGSPGCYVLDPRTLKVRHFELPGHANPWCYVFDWWGQGIVGDGTTPQQHWDTPLSGAAFPGRKGLNTAFNGDGVRPNCGSEFLYSRQFPDDVQGQFIFACVVNVHGLARFEITSQGAGYQGGRKRKTVEGKLVPDDLLTSDDGGFRPVDPQFGPDGALYFGDFCNPVVGHMTYSQRDPARGHSHGRVYRLVYKEKPLLTPAIQYGKSVLELLDQLKEYEPRTRYRARRELRDRPAEEVIASTRRWVAALDSADPAYDHHLLEALWVEQGQHAVEPEFLQRVLRAKTPEARAGATRVLADEWDRVPNALALVRPQVTDEFARTRVEAIRALSFVKTEEAVETVLQANHLPRDYWLDYTLHATLNALEQVWKKPFEEKRIATNDPQGLALLDEVVKAKLPGGAAEMAFKRFFLATDHSNKGRAELFHEIAEAKGVREKGRDIFRRVCVACHKYGEEGLENGPPLTEVASRLKKEEIIESILVPSAKIDPKFATTVCTLKDGTTAAGIVAVETPELLTLRLPGGVSQAVRVSDIATREVQKISGMPEGLAAAMSPAEFIDLVEFLATSGQPQK